MTNFMIAFKELTPWKGTKLPKAQDAFNYYLSLHRQVIERSFGQLVARWGIFWRAIALDFRVIEEVGFPILAM